jgi:hypothetical protein
MTIALWPTKDEYDITVEDYLYDNVYDEDLRNGKLDLGASGPRRLGGANRYVMLYKIKAQSGNNYVMRCFCRNENSMGNTGEGKDPLSLIAQRYERLSLFCLQKATANSSLLPFSYIPQGIKVACYQNIPDSCNPSTEDTLFPVVKMPFVEGPSLGDFIVGKYQDEHTMHLLCAAWEDMINELKQLKMAHGDLDLTNVLVDGLPDGRIVLKLIDYDNAWIEGLENYEKPEFGHEHFQQPGVNRPGGAEMDRFSALVMFISLKALAEIPNLYNEFKAEEKHRLLFSADDYHNEMDGKPSRITQLRARGITSLEPYLDELSWALQERGLPRHLSEIMQKPRPARSQPPVVSTDPPGERLLHPAWDEVEYYGPEKQVPVDAVRLEEKWHPQPSPRIQPEPAFHTPQLDSLSSWSYEQKVQLPGPATSYSHIPQPDFQSSHSQQYSPPSQSPADSSLMPPHMANVPLSPYDEPTGLATSERDAQASSLKDPQAWLGCAILLVIVIVIAVIIYLVLFTNHSTGNAAMLPHTYFSLSFLIFPGTGFL